LLPLPLPLPLLSATCRLPPALTCQASPLGIPHQLHRLAPVPHVQTGAALTQHPVAQALLQLAARDAESLHAGQAAMQMQALALDRAARFAMLP
jgi:hypothetical protein